MFIGEAQCTHDRCCNNAVFADRIPQQGGLRTLRKLRGAAGSKRRKTMLIEVPLRSPMSISGQRTSFG